MIHVVVLQVALAGVITHGAIDGVVDEQELEGRAVRLLRGFTVRANHHAVVDLAVARDLELWHLLDFDEAHAAVAVHGQVGVPAEMRDLYPQLESGADHGRAGLDLDLAPVDGAFRHGYLSSSPAITLRPPMMATASAIVQPRIISGKAW